MLRRSTVNVPPKGALKKSSLIGRAMILTFPRFLPRTDCQLAPATWRTRVRQLRTFLAATLLALSPRQRCRR